MRRHLDLARNPRLEGLECSRSHASIHTIAESKRYATASPCGWFLSTAHTEADIDFALEATHAGFKALASAA
jgi:glutamate-1-semialdehyde aminotransferase